jgi:hypothetical protein
MEDFASLEGVVRIRILRGLALFGLESNSTPCSGHVIPHRYCTVRVQTIKPVNASKIENQAFRFSICPEILVLMSRITIEHRASSIEHRASSIEHRASSIEHRASSIEHRASRPSKHSYI